jgi:hypothetical protein
VKKATERIAATPATTAGDKARNSGLYQRKSAAASSACGPSVAAFSRRPSTPAESPGFV